MTSIVISNTKTSVTNSKKFLETTTIVWKQQTNHARSVEIRANICSASTTRSLFERRSLINMYKLRGRGHSIIHFRFTILRAGLFLLASERAISACTIGVDVIEAYVILCFRRLSIRIFLHSFFPFTPSRPKPV